MSTTPPPPSTPGRGSTRLAEALQLLSGGGSTRRESQPAGAGSQAAGATAAAAGSNPAGTASDAVAGNQPEESQGILASAIQSLVSVLTQQNANQAQNANPSTPAAASAAAPPQPQPSPAQTQPAQQQGTGAVGLGSVLAALRQMNGGNDAPPPPGGGNNGRSGSGDGGGQGGGFGGLVRGAGLAAAGITGLAFTARLLNRRFTAMTERTLQLNGVLEQYNGSIAQANALAEARGIERSIRQGEAIAPGYARLSAAQSEYRDMQQEFAAPIQNLGLNITASLAEGRNAIMRKVEPWMDAIGKVANKLSAWLGADAPEPTLVAARAFLSDVSDGKFDGKGTTYMNPGQTPLMGDRDRRRVFGG